MVDIPKINTIMQMVPLVQRSVESLVNVFRERAESGKSFEFFRYNTFVHMHNHIIPLHHHA